MWGSNLGQNTEYPDGSRGFLSVLNKLTTVSCQVPSNSLLTTIQPIDAVLLTASLNKGITVLLKHRLPQMFRQKSSICFLRSVTVSLV
jgi:hypothetical protein